MELVESYKVVSTGEILKIYLDEDAESPRTGMDNVCMLVTSHKRYKIGDKEAENTHLYNSWDEWRENELPKDCICSPVYMMDHSSQTLSLNPFGGLYGYFDSGQVGYIYVTLERAKQYYDSKLVSLDLNTAFKWFQQELDVMNQWLHGEVLGYVLEAADGEHVDSCWGFYGSNIKDSGILDQTGLNLDNLEKVNEE